MKYRLMKFNRLIKKYCKQKQWEDTWSSFNNIECDKVLMLPRNLQTDPDQSVEDEIAAFEAELAAELGEAH